MAVQSFYTVSDLYKQYRPIYPDDLYQHLASITLCHNFALDCGTGNGQAVIGLSSFFDYVLGVDISSNLLGLRFQKENTFFSLGSSSRLPVKPSTIDLITVAQAIHWFDLDSFYEEAQRVLKPQGIIAIWCYHHTRISPEIDKILEHYYDSVLQPYWALNMSYVREHYRTLEFPFEELPAPRFVISKKWEFDDLMGYVMSWSSTLEMIHKEGRFKFELLEEELLSCWVDTTQKKIIEWELYLRIGRFHTG